MTNQGTLLINNLRLDKMKSIKPFSVAWEDFNEVVQLDVCGYGILNYEGVLDQEMAIEIKTNIHRALSRYGELTNHNASDIHYTLNFAKSKRFSHEHQAYYAKVEMSIYYVKPVKKAHASQLLPTTELITSIILGEIFITGRNARKI